MTLLAFILGACAAPRRHVDGYSERLHYVSAQVAIAQGVQPEMALELQSRLESSLKRGSIFSAQRAAYLDVFISSISFDGGLRGNEAVAMVVADARDANNNSLIIHKQFEVRVIGDNRMTVNHGLAQATADRLQYEFGLAPLQPSDIRIPVTTSTQMKSDGARRLPNFSPSPNGDAILNSGTQFGTSGEIAVERPSPPPQAGDVLPLLRDAGDDEGAEEVQSPAANEDVCVVTVDNDCSEMLEAQ